MLSLDLIKGEGGNMEPIHLSEPKIGSWYKDKEERVFEVVAVDSADGSIEIQHFDGTVEELEVNAWLSLVPVETEPPEDWSGSMDIMSDDYKENIDGEGEPTWIDPLDSLDRLER